MEADIASGLIKLYMKKNSFKGWTSFWNTIYYIDESAMANEKIRAHELKHIEQIERDGRFMFFVKYCYFWLKYGYKNNPYEVESRAAANEL